MTIRAILFVTIAAVLPGKPARAEAPADLVILRGKVLTLDEKVATAEAVAMRAGVFSFVGSNAGAKKQIGRKTRVIDARGKSVIPGLIDSHVHALEVAESEAAQRFEPLTSIAEIQDWIRKKTAATPGGRWIKIPRDFPTRLDERRFPTREELDAVSPKHPVIFDGGFAFVLNTKALEDGRITGDTQIPGGKVVQDARGAPSGLLLNARGLMTKFFPPTSASEEEVLDGLERVHRRYSALGITSVHERLGTVATYRTYEKLRKQGRLNVRATVTIGLVSDGTIEATETFIRGLPFRFGEGDDWVRVGPLKILADGGILTGTAYLREPYGLKGAQLFAVTDPTYRGSPTLGLDKLKNLIRTGHRLGWQMCSHVTGDAGTDLVLDAVEAVDRTDRIRDRRYTLIHSYFSSPEQAERAAALGVGVDTQPGLLYKDADAMFEVLGEARMRSFIGMRNWLDRGVRAAINSDHMLGLDGNASLHLFNPFLLMQTVVTRTTEGGRPIGPEQRVSRQEALRMMTIHPAWLAFDEMKKGTIEVGKLGDLAVLTEDLMACEPDRIKDIRARVTVVGGKVVYESRR